LVFMHMNFQKMYIFFLQMIFHTMIPALYRIFIELFATRFSMKDSLISDEVIVELLREQDIPEDKIDEWAKFFSELSAFVFYTVHGSKEQKKLFDQANKWVVVLKEVI